MFGKGVYFADMVSKSANYCHTNKSSPTGILLLCEVALGNMYACSNMIHFSCYSPLFNKLRIFRHELKAADYVTKLPKGKHSTKGIGMTFPDPEATQTIGKGVKVPLGKPVQSSERSSLLYNEFIVYDVAQINIKYLLQVNFDFKF